jgi:uncharacterized protein YgiM (DUF1202 family)
MEVGRYACDGLKRESIMLGIVTAHRLNVRSKPDKNSSKRGVLAKGTAIPVTGQLDDWIEFRYKDFPAYVYKSYVSLLSKDRDISAIVTADLLNVRSGPDLRSSIIGKLPLFSSVEIISLLPLWAEIHFNDGVGYVQRDHIELQQVDGSTQGKVIAGVLNVRNQPSAKASRLGQLTANTVVAIEGRTGDWLRIQFNGAQGFVHSRYIREIEASDEQPPPGPAESDDDTSPVPSTDHREHTALSPERQLPTDGDATTRKVARTWNQYGRLLTELCDTIEMDVACAVSVLCVESSGKGFQSGNDGRMIIRFENHKFWKFWGRDNPEAFRRHFVFQSGKIWKGHKWRRDADDAWQTFHGNQVKEWQVLNFARTFNDEAALFSISMGAPQIMGFHFARIGYPTVAAMFEDFSRDIEAHIRGLMHFFDKSMITALQSLDFEAFAGRYNGSGQKKTYGRRIKEHYDAFKLLAMTHSL